MSIAATGLLMPCIAGAQKLGSIGPGPTLASSGLRMVLSLFAVLSLLWLCAWLVRRWRDRQSVSGGAIEIVSGVALGAKERVVLLKVGDEQVLVGVSPAGMSSLHVCGDKRPTFSLSKEAAE